MEHPVTLVIFSSEGREHLLQQTYPSFLQHCKYRFAETILAIDGKYDIHSTGINPDVVVQQFNRRGYVTSIQSAINNIKTPYFFWLEDDFIFNLDVPVDYMLQTMQDDTWAGMCLTRAQLQQEDIVQHYFDDLYVPNFGYSVSPALCNTQHLKDAIKALYEVPKDSGTRFYGFEPFINDFFVEHNLKYAFINPPDGFFVNHIGELESTAREYHMMNSIDEMKTDIGKNYVSGLQRDRKITLYNKVGMMLKVWYTAFILSFKLFSDRRSYDFAFRVYNALLRGFKY